MVRRTLALVLLLLFIAGCGDNREAGLELAKKGEETAQSLENFYTKLYRYKTDEIELEAFKLGTRESPIAIANLEMRFKILKALESRIDLARTMKNSYASLKDLSEYNARSEIRESAGNLLTSFNGLVPLPGGKVPSSFFGTLIAELQAAQQSGDIRKGAEALRTSLLVTQSIYKSEHPDANASDVKLPEAATLGRDSFDIKSNSLYDVIIEERYKNLWVVVDKLIENDAMKQFAFGPDAVKPFVLEIVLPADSKDRKIVTAGLQEVAEVRMFQQFRADLAEADTQEIKLKNLLKAHEELFKKHQKGTSR